ncbi:Ca2-binding protein [Aureococcus anophagefferens]|nr:Ca2-binding protein [Aureococcus anophagefferens]
MPGLSLLLEQRAAHQAPRVLEQDPEKPLGWKAGDEVSKRPKSAPAPVTSRSKPGLQAVFSMFDQGSGSMDTRRLGACLHKLGIRRPDAPQRGDGRVRRGQVGKIGFDGCRRVTTLRASDGLRLGEIGARCCPRRQRASDAKAAFDKIDADGGRHPGQDKGDSTKRHRAGAPLNAVAALADLFEERRKADKVKQVAISAALAALHRGATTIKDIAMLAESTVRVLVGQQTSDAVTRILKEAGEGALEAALALARTELMLACETGDLDVVKKALAKGAPPDTRQRDCDGTRTSPRRYERRAGPRRRARPFGRDAYLRRLVKEGCPPNASRPGTASPLILAAKNDHLRCVEFLCNDPDLMGVTQLDAKDEQAKTAVAWAQAGDHKPVIEVINKARARAANGGLPEGQPAQVVRRPRRPRQLASAGALGAKSKSGRRRSFSGSFGDKPEKKAA